MADARGLDVSIVLPVFNESGHVVEDVARIRAAMDASAYTYEIIVVDDGSTDGSADLVSRSPGVQLIRLRHNMGPGAARRMGTQAASGRVVVWTDVDMSYPNDRIPWLVGQLDGYDQVVGARDSEQGTRKWLRVPAKWLIRRLAEYLSGSNIPDLNSGFRAFRRSVGAQFLYLLPSGFSHVTTMTVVFLSNGYSVGYVPIEYSARAGRSKFRFVKDTRRYVLQVVRMIMMWEPLRILGPFATVILLVASGKLVFDVVDKDFGVASNTLLLFGGGFGVLLVGLVADLVVQVTRVHDPVPPAATIFSEPVDGG